MPAGGTNTRSNPIQVFASTGVTDFNAMTLDLSSGQYQQEFSLARSTTTPPFDDLNSCALSPGTYRLYCAVKIASDAVHAYIVRVTDQTSIGVHSQTAGTFK